MSAGFGMLRGDSVSSEGMHRDACGSDGSDGSSQHLAIRVPVTLETYGRVAELSRGSGLTLEGAASVLLARAAIRQQVASLRHPPTLETRWVTTPSTYLAGEGEAGSPSTPVRMFGEGAFQHPAPTELGTEASLVESSESGAGHW